MGRKSKLTAEVHKQIVDAIKVGNNVTAVVDYIGISRETYYEWIRRGIKEREAGKTTVYSAFADEVERAPAFAEVFHVQNIYKASKTNPYFSKWWLEHKRPMEYSSHSTVGIIINDVELIAKLATTAVAEPLNVPNLNEYKSADTVPPMIEAPKQEVEDAEIVLDAEFDEPPEPATQLDIVQPAGEVKHEEIKAKTDLSTIAFTL